MELCFLLDGVSPSASNLRKILLGMAAGRFQGTKTLVDLIGQKKFRTKVRTNLRPDHPPPERCWYAKVPLMKPGAIYPMLVVDVGNSNVKFAVVSRKRGKPKILAVEPTKKLTSQRVLSLWQKSRASTAAAACVVPPVEKILRASLTDLMLIDAQAPLNFTTLVEGKTVGADRLANMAEARQRFGKNVLVADFGTAATFDLLDLQGTFVGGAIAPGLKTLARALVSETAQLPTADFSPVRRYAGRTTSEALRAGVSGGYAGLIAHLLDSLRDGSTMVVFTGGEAKEASRLRRGKVRLDPLWTLRGIAVLGALRAERE